MLEHRAQLLEVDRLSHVHVEARARRAAAVVLRAVAGERDEEHPGAALGANLPRDLISIELRQPDVHERDLRAMTQRSLDALPAVGRLEDLVPVVLEQHAQHLARVVVVFDDQDAAPARRLAPRRRGRRRDRVLEHGQPDDEAAPSTEAFALRLDAPVVQLREPAHQREPDAEPALRALEPAVALDEEIEDVRQQLGLDADSVVLHRQGDVRALVPDRHADVSSGRRVAERVSHDVRHDLLDAHRIGTDHGGARLHRDLVRVQLARRPHRRELRADDLGQVQGLGLDRDLPGHDAADVEEVVDELREAAHLPRADGARADGGRIFTADLLEEVERRRDRAERVA